MQGYHTTIAYIPLHLSPVPPLQQPSVCSSFLWLCLCFALFVHLLWFLKNSTCAWNHAVFVSLCLFSLNKAPPRFIRVAGNGRISFFLIAEWYSIVSTPHLLHPFLYRWTPRLLPPIGYYYKYNTPMSIAEHLSFLRSVLDFFRYIPRSGVAGSCASSSCSLSRSLWFP